jgi:hypothetical protein
MRFVIQSAVVALLLCVVPQFAQAQFGLKVPKFDTGPVKKLLGEIDKVVAEYEDATEKVWTATETMQDIIKAYAAGDFPVLEKPWGEIRKMIKEAKDEAARTAAFQLSEKYFKEMDERKKAVDAVMDDPVKATDIKGKLQPPEVEQFKTISTNLKPVPQQDAELITRATKLSADAAKAVADLTAQAAKDPLKAADYKKLIDQCNKGIEKLGKIPTELEKQVKAVEGVISNLAKLIGE